MVIAEVLPQLDRFDTDSGSLEELHEICDRLSACDDARDAVPGVLKFIEQNPHADLGCPGPLVHFLEQFFRSGYEEALARSVEQRPTLLNAWMLNRLINGTDGNEKMRYRLVMEQVAAHASDSEVRKLAAEFLGR